MVAWFLDVVFRILPSRCAPLAARNAILSWQAPMSLLIRLAAWLGMLIVGFALLVATESERPSGTGLFRSWILDIHPRLRGAVER